MFVKWIEQNFILAVGTGIYGDSIDEKEYELQQIQEETSDAQRENQAMLDEAKYKQTDDYVEDRARDIFGLRDEDDVIFKPGKTED